MIRSNETSDNCIDNSPVICTFSVVFQVNETILKSIVTYPNQDYFFAANFSELSESLDRIVRSSCREIFDQCTTTELTSMLRGSSVYRQTIGLSQRLCASDSNFVWLWHVNLKILLTPPATAERSVAAASVYGLLAVISLLFFLIDFLRKIWTDRSEICPQCARWSRRR